MTQTITPDTSDRLDIPGVQILEEIGRGAHSVVFRGRIGGQLCAVKVRRDTPEADAQRWRLRYRREAAVLARFAHPGLAAIIEAGETANDARPYLLMEYVEGATLAEVIAEDAPLDQARVVAIATMAASALAEVHRHGLVHRDIKPGNILVRGSDGAIKLIDFGFATRTRNQQGGRAVVGTLRYSAPEQTGMLQRPVDGRSDLYSLGIVLYECATGRPPFGADEASELVRQHAVDAPVPVRQHNDAISPVLARIIDKLLAKDPDNRYASCAALLADLGQIERLERVWADGAPLRLGEHVNPLEERPQSPMVGRHREFSRLESAWLAARSGRGQIRWVTGPPGSGATRLVDALAVRGMADGAFVFTVRCDEADQTPFAAIRCAGEDFIRVLHSLPSEKATAWMAHIEEATQEHMPLLAGLISDAFDLPDAARRFVAEDPGSPTRYADAIASFFVHLASAEWPVMFVVDDIPAMDDASRHVFAQIAYRLERCHFLLVCTADADDEQEASPANVLDQIDTLPFASLRVGPLDEEAVGELVAEQLGGKRLSERVVRQITARTQGLPLAVREYLFAMLEAGLLQPTRTGWQVDSSGFADLELPADVTHLMLRRLVELDDVSRDVLRAAAAEGQRFHLGLCARYSGHGAAAVSKAIGRAVALRLIEHARDDTYAFVHQRVRAALLDELDAATTRAVHQRIAESLDDPDADGHTHLFAVARHYALGEVDEHRPRVYQTNLQAGLVALHNHAFEEAYEFLSTARRVGAPADDDDTTSPLARALGEACAGSGRVDEALAHFDGATDAAATPVERARLRGRIARVQMAALEMDDAWAQVHRALAELNSTVSSLSVVRALGTLVAWLFAWVLARFPKRTRPAEAASPMMRLRAQLYETGAITAFFRLDHELMGALVIRALYAARRLPDCGEKARAFSTYAAVLAILGRADAARRYAARARVIAEVLDDRSVMARARWFEATTYEFLGAPLRAEHLLRTTIAEFGLWLELWEYVIVCGELGGLLLDRGYAGEAVSWGRRILDRTEAGASHGEVVHMERVYGLYLIACAKAWGGESMEARKYVDRAHTLLDGRETVGLGEASAVGYELAVHYECGNRGHDVDALLDKWAGFGLVPDRTPHQIRRFYIYQAYVCLDRLRWARKFDKRAARVRFLAALDELSLAADTPKFMTHLCVVRSEWEAMLGHTERADALLARAELLADEADSPWGSFEVDVRRARRLAQQGNQTAALRRAQRAHRLAVERGWKSRARDVRADFDFFDTTASNLATTSRSRGRSHSASEGSTDAQSLKLQRYLEALLQVAVASGTVFDPEEQARVALDEIVRIFGAERAFLFSDHGGLDGGAYGGEALHMVAGRDMRGRDLQDCGDYSTSVLERVCRERTPVVSTGSDEGEVLASASAVHHNLRSIMAGPVQIQDHFLGVVYVDSRIARGVFARDDAEILMAISSHIGIAQETARAARLEVDIASERKKRELADVIRKTTTAMTATLDLSKVLQRLIEGVERVIAADRAVAFLLEGDRLELFVEQGEDGETIGDASDWVFGDPRIERVLETMRPQMSGQGSELESQLSGAFSEVDGEQSWLGVPIVSRGELAGMMLVERDEPDAYGLDDVQLALALAGQAGIAIQNARLYAEVERLAVLDDLTQLPNRRRLFEVAEEEFRRARRYEHSLSVIMIDVDHFKQVNDSFGHAIGDDILREVSRRCVEVLRETDTIGRYGGEEFVVIMPETPLDKACEHVAERLRAAVAKPPVDTGAGPVNVTISLGVAQLASFDDTIDDLINRADAALYDAKEAGRNRVRRSSA